MVTPRLHTLTIQGERVHQIGVPIHFGYSGEVTGSQANELIPIITDRTSRCTKAKRSCARCVKVAWRSPRMCPRSR